MVLDRVSRDEAGFTVLELFAVIAIIGILLGIAFASYVPASGRAASVACAQNQRILEEAFITYSMQHPDVAHLATLEELRPMIKNFDQSTVCPSDGSPYALDPASGEVSCPNHP
ncbi:MAG TPA: prepilin-type N-terminal cleavage/methylation domain-containing protein [Coriobacteriia bacterium]|nr:prepilin-type N-terminal cleavage/methylation domain-containing protein [Coriobacteriia bacterium]